MAIVNTSPKGQLLIPSKLRKKFGITPGNPVQIIEQEDHLIIKPIPEDPIKAAKGILPASSPSLTEELINERKKEMKKDEHICS